MFKRRTVFVIGAGAGCDLNMPVGTDLAKDIARRLDLQYDDFQRQQGAGDKLIINALKLASPFSWGQLEKAAWTIRDGIVLANSIDDFLDLHKDSDLVLKMGKVAIVRSIVNYEAGSKLAVRKQKGRTGVDLANLADSWLAAFIKALAPGTREKNQLFEQVTFINFNYDRCVEQFLEHALPPLLDIDQGHALSICRSVRIIHPYGSLGLLPGWTTSSDDTVEFAEASLANQRLLSAAERIKTYTEQVTDRSVLEAMQTAIRTAEQIVFLGFAFHEQNMALLRPATPSRGAQLFATAIGIGEEDRELVRREIGKLFHETSWAKAKFGNVRIRHDVDCVGMFTQYQRVLRDGA